MLSFNVLVLILLVTNAPEVTQIKQEKLVSAVTFMHNSTNNQSSYYLIQTAVPCIDIWDKIPTKDGIEEYEVSRTRIFTSPELLDFAIYVKKDLNITYESQQNLSAPYWRSVIGHTVSQNESLMWMNLLRQLWYENHKIHNKLDKKALTDMGFSVKQTNETPLWMIWIFCVVVAIIGIPATIRCFLQA